MSACRIGSNRSGANNYGGLGTGFMQRLFSEYKGAILETKLNDLSHMVLNGANLSTRVEVGLVFTCAHLVPYFSLVRGRKKIR
jgi:hypothetical protein